MRNKKTNAKLQNNAAGWASCEASSGGGVDIKNKKKRVSRSVRFQTWTYFFLLAALALFVLWLFQFLFFKSSYRAMKKQEVEKLGEKIVDRYPGEKGDNRFDDYLRQTAFNNGLNIIVFNVGADGCALDDVCLSAEYISSQFNAGALAGDDLLSKDNPHISFDWSNFYSGIKGKDKVSYVKNYKNTNYFVYGARLNDSGSYLYMMTPYIPMESTISVMADQLLIATVVCLVLSIIVSYFISERITKPITDFSKVARKLGAGDYTVRFKGNGYTEIDNLAETLNYATTEIGKTEQMRRDFLANVSHDLRTPLTMVKAYAEMLRDISGGDEVKRVKHSQVIIDEADRLTGLVNDILNLSKLQSGTETLQMSAVDLRMLAKTVIERFDVFSSRDGYVFDFESEGDCVAICDIRRLEQVVYNLVGNALNYTGESKTVKITAKGNGEKVRVTVRDYGSGIAPEELDKVWERYYRANQNRRNVVGSGLGLSIVKSVLTAHNAEFGVSSNLGEGTEFWFELKAVCADLTESKNEQEKSGGRKNREHK